MKSNRKLKVCFAASTGGHYEQLMMLKPLMKKYGSFILTERTEYEIGNNEEKVYYVPQINRKEKLFVFKFLWCILISFWIFLKERPDAVICTGVLATIPMCLLAKLLKKKLIYIESFAKITSPTLTGKMLYKYADQFYVQWESMKEFYPNAICLGGIY